MLYLHSEGVGLKSKLFIGGKKTQNTRFYQEQWPEREIHEDDGDGTWKHIKWRRQLFFITMTYQATPPQTSDFQAETKMSMDIMI